MKLGFAGIAFGALLVAAPAAHANLVNGSFETGDFTGWGTDTDSQVTVQPFTNAPVEDGSYAAEFNAYYGNPATLGQTIATGIGTYELSFWVYQQGPQGDGQNVYLNVTWDGISVVSYLNPNDLVLNQYVEYTAMVTGTGSDILEFAGANDCCYMYLDNVQLNCVGVCTPVPEPGALALFGTGLMSFAGFATLRRRRKFI